MATYKDLTLADKQLLVTIPNPCTSSRDRERMEYLHQKYNVTKTTLRQWRRNIVVEVAEAKAAAEAANG